MSVSIKQLRDHKMTFPELTESLARLQDESDRSSAIIGAAILEASLLAAIRSRLPHPEHFSESFSLPHRVSIGRALGLVSKKMAEDIDVISKVRNAFAHNGLAINFDHEAIASECMKLHLKLQREMADQLRALEVDIEDYEMIDDLEGLLIVDVDDRIAFEARIERATDARGSFESCVKANSAILQALSLRSRPKVNVEAYREMEEATP